MKLTALFNKYLKLAQDSGIDYEKVNNLAGCTERKIVLSLAEVYAGKLCYDQMMSEKLWNDPEFNAERGWLFGSPKTEINIGLVPLKLAEKRLGLNRHLWDKYNQIY
jgi:hypothetical protein